MTPQTVVELRPIAFVGTSRTLTNARLTTGPRDGYRSTAFFKTAALMAVNCANANDRRYASIACPPPLERVDDQRGPRPVLWEVSDGALSALFGWSAGGLGTFRVALVTDLDEMRTAAEELSGTHGRPTT